MEDFTEETQEEIISREMAEVEWERFTEAFDIYTDVDNLSLEGKDEFETKKGNIVNKIIRGLITIDENGMLTYKLQKPGGDVKELVFKEPNGKAYASFDKYKDSQSIGKVNAMLNHMTGKPSAFFLSLQGRDIKVCHTIVNLFLAG